MKSKIGVVILASIFAATFAGVALIWAAAARTIRLVRNGEVTLALNPPEPRLGEFSPPAHVPPSQPHTDLYHRWRVLLCFPDAKDERGFDVVIDPASKA
jgi:hypothetical protein